MEIIIFQLSDYKRGWKDYNFRIYKSGSYSSGIKLDGTVVATMGGKPSGYSINEIQFIHKQGDIDD